jgi:hypothetical protein
LLIAPVRMPVVVLVAVLGLGFALFGLLGRINGSNTPCGCFGASGRSRSWTTPRMGCCRHRRVRFCCPCT